MELLKGFATLYFASGYMVADVKMKLICTSSLLLIAMVFLDCSCALTPVTSEDGSGVDVPEEMATLQYCIIDNLTILRLDTGEQLDIIYTKDSILVVTTNDSQTTTAVPRLYNEPVCSMNSFPSDLVVSSSFYIATSVWTALLLSITGYNIIKCLLYKELHNPMGKLLMTYSIFLAVRSVSFFMILMLIHKFSVNSNTVCLTIKLLLIATNIGYEATATCILVHCTYHFRQSYKMIPKNPREDKRLLRRYFGYIIGTMAISMFMILTYILGISVNNGKFNGFCTRQDPIYHTLQTIMYAISTSNGLIQIAAFILYLYYWYKMWKSQHITDYRINKKIFLISVGMGATISTANFIYFVNWIGAWANGTSLSALVEIIGTLMLMLQQFIIAGSLSWVEKICKTFCKKNLRPEVHTSASQGNN